MWYYFFPQFCSFSCLRYPFFHEYHLNWIMQKVSWIVEILTIDKLGTSTTVRSARIVSILTFWTPITYEKKFVSEKLLISFSKFSIDSYKFISLLLFCASKEFVCLLSSESGDMKPTDKTMLHFDGCERLLEFEVVLYLPHYTWGYRTTHNTVNPMPAWLRRH